MKQHRLYERAFDRALLSLRVGALQVTYPNGERKTYGGAQPGPEAELRILNPNFFRKSVLFGEIGFGESFVDGDWETDDIVGLLSWLIINIESANEKQRRLPMTDLLLVLNRIRHRLRANSVRGSRRNIFEHYDLGNDFFALFLDPGMTYSCAHFGSTTQSLEEAQSEKYDKLCQKLKLSASDRVLEIGGGWGGFAVHAVKNYGCHVTSLTISRQQLEYASARVARQGLSDQVEFRLCDYRDVGGKFDKIVSIEMLEAVGHKYLKPFFAKCHDLLERSGLLGIQVITCPDSRYDSHRANVTWMQKHIFPGGLLPSIGMMNKVINQTGDLHLHSLEEMGLHYARTLRTWHNNFNQAIDAVLAQGFNERFIRKWNLYLTMCEAAFLTRNINVVQAVYTRPNNLQI